MLLKNSQNGTRLASIIILGKFKNCINCFSAVYSKIKRNLSVPSKKILTPTFPTRIFWNDGPVHGSIQSSVSELVQKNVKVNGFDISIKSYPGGCAGISNLCAKRKIRVTFPSKVKMPFFRVNMNQNAWCFIDHTFTWLLSRWTWLFLYPLKDHFNYFNPKRYRIVWYICMMFLYKVFDP